MALFFNTAHAYHGTQDDELFNKELSSTLVASVKR